MSYKKITIEFEDGRVHEIENPIAYKVWQWADVECALRDYVLDDDTPEDEIKQKFEQVKDFIDEWVLKGALEKCTDSDWYAITYCIEDALEG